MLEISLFSCQRCLSISFRFICWFINAVVRTKNQKAIAHHGDQIILTYSHASDNINRDNIKRDNINRDNINRDNNNHDNIKGYNIDRGFIGPW